jgi:hypothetical protein
MNTDWHIALDFHEELSMTRSMVVEDREAL